MIVLYRPRKETLEDSLKECSLFRSTEAMKNHIAVQFKNIGMDNYGSNDIIIGESEGDDERIGWKDIRSVFAIDTKGRVPKLPYRVGYCTIINDVKMEKELEARLLEMEENKPSFSIRSLGPLKTERDRGDIMNSIKGEFEKLKESLPTVTEHHERTATKIANGAMRRHRVEKLLTDHQEVLQLFFNRQIFGFDLDKKVVGREYDDSDVEMTYVWSSAQMLRAQQKDKYSFKVEELAELGELFTTLAKLYDNKDEKGIDK